MKNMITGFLLYHDFYFLYVSCHDDVHICSLLLIDFLYKRVSLSVLVVIKDNFSVGGYECNDRQTSSMGWNIRSDYRTVYRQRRTTRRNFRTCPRVPGGCAAVGSGLSANGGQFAVNAGALK